MWYLEQMQTPEEQSPTTVVYLSATSQGLGAGWDVMQVIYKERGVTRNSVMIASDARGASSAKLTAFPKHGKESATQKLYGPTTSGSTTETGC